ncbi:PREDICTED: homeobox protein Hox-D9, partial [Buceros rhinoceros silvestris]|uniref:homeobox protein Hox-D9 n=1 Tax=Buceros rhinoceros silvestris TaxID=175836 RepID=UPI0005292809
MSSSGTISNYYVDSLIGHESEEVYGSRFVQGGDSATSRPSGGAAASGRYVRSWIEPFPGFPGGGGGSASSAGSSTGRHYGIKPETGATASSSSSSSSSSSKRTECSSS